MVPDKFNMVDMGGIDFIMSQGEEVPGLYNRLVESIAQCRYQCLYNWFFDGVVIPPSYVEMEVNENDEVAINEGVTVSPDDVIHIYSIEPSPVDPEIIPLLVEENGIYTVPAGKNGFNPVTVDVPSYTPVIEPISITENGTYTAPAGTDGYSPVAVNVQASPSKYEYLTPNYAGLGYSYVSTGGDYYGSNNYGQMLSIYEVPAGDYVVFCGNPVGTRFRCMGFYGKTTEDFMPAREVSMSQTLLFNGDLNVTGITERADDKLLERIYFTMAQSGCVAVGTSNTGQTVESILLKINS